MMNVELGVCAGKHADGCENDLSNHRVRLESAAVGSEGECGVAAALKTTTKHSNLNILVARKNLLYRLSGHL